MTEVQRNVQATVRESRLADKEGIFKLREAVYQEPFDAEEYHWKFEKNSGIPSRIYVAEIDGYIVGLRAFIIERIKILEREWHTGLGVDIMVHPDFRRYGIASQVANGAFEEMESAGSPILVGFPNEAAFKVYSRRRSNWRHVCSIPMLVKPLDFDGILRKYIKNSLIRALAKVPVGVSWALLFRGKAESALDLTVKRVHGFDERFDTLWDEVRHQFPILLVRDKAFLRWRFSEKPGTEYVTFVAEQRGQLVGYIVVRGDQMMGLRVGFILDMLTTNHKVASALLSEAIQHFKGEGEDAIGCLMLQHTPYFKVLRKAGFVVAPKRLMHKEFYFGVQVKPSVLADETINKRSNWYLTFADTDLA